MKKEKLRVVIDYNKLSDEVKTKLQKDYPEGYSDYLIEYTNQKNEIIHALRFETEDKIYLIKVSKELAVKIRILDEEDIQLFSVSEEEFPEG